MHTQLSGSIVVAHPTKMHTKLSGSIVVAHPKEARIPQQAAMVSLPSAFVAQAHSRTAAYWCLRTAPYPESPLLVRQILKGGTRPSKLRQHQTGISHFYLSLF